MTVLCAGEELCPCDADVCALGLREGSVGSRRGARSRRSAGRGWQLFAAKVGWVDPLLAERPRHGWFSRMRRRLYGWLRDRSLGVRNAGSCAGSVVGVGCGPGAVGSVKRGPICRRSADSCPRGGPTSILTSPSHTAQATLRSASQLFHQPDHNPPSTRHHLRPTCNSSLDPRPQLAQPPRSAARAPHTNSLPACGTRSRDSLRQQPPPCRALASAVTPQVYEFLQEEQPFSFRVSAGCAADYRQAG